MKKVKNIFIEDLKKLGDYSTGLILELEDGTMLQQNTTDVIEPYSKYKPNN